MPTYLRRILYGLLGLVAFVLLLVILVVVALQFPAAQDFAARQASSFLQNKIGTEVQIGKFRTDWRNAISLDDVYLEDQQGDTLLSVGHLGVDIDLWALTKSQINVSSVELNDGTVNIERTLPDSTFNFDYITAAFATGDTATAPVDTASAGFQYNIGDARLTNIRLRYDDQVEGMAVQTRVGELAVNMDAVDVDASTYRIDQAALRNTAINIVQSKNAPPDTAAAEPLELELGLNKAVLDNVSLTYKNAPSAQYINTRVGRADITADNIDLRNSRVALNTLLLRNTSFAYAQNEEVPTEQRLLNPAEAVRDLNEAVETATGQEASWVVTLKKSDISGVDVAFDNFNEPKQQTRVRGMDYNHLKFTDLILNTENLFYSENRTTGRIVNLAGQEQSGFAVESATADVVFDSVQTRLDNLDLITPHTRIRRTLAVGYESLDALADTTKIGQIRLEADLNETRLGFRDILYLAPDLADTPPFTTGPNQSVLVSGRVNGRVGDLRVQDLDVVGFRNTVLRASGRIQGLPEVDRRLYTDLNIAQFTTTDADIKSLVPAGTIPPEYRLPPRIAVAGTFRGRPTALVFDTDLRVNTSFGNATAVVNMQLGPVGQEPVTARFSVQNFNVGAILRDTTIGRITTTGRLNARGLDPATMRGRLVANVQRAEYSGYTYRDIAATVDIDRNRYVIAAESKNDPNLNLDLLATVNLRDANNPSYEISSLNLRGANLTALGFYTGGDLRVQGQLTANLSGADANSINGTFAGRNVVIVRDNQPIALDSLSGRIVQRAGRTEVAFTSSLLNVNLEGNTGLGDVATVLQQHIDRYFDLPDVRYQPGGPARNFTFSAQLLDSSIVARLVPGLTQISPFALEGSFDSRAANLTVQARIPLIVYTGYRLDSLRLNVDSDPQKLEYALRLRQISQDTSLRLPNPSLVGNVANNKVATRLRVAETDSAVQLDLAGVLQVLNQGNTYAFSFDPRLILNQMQWAVAPGNELAYTLSSGAIRADDVRLSQGNQFIELETLPGAEYPLQARLGNLDLNMLATAAGQPDSLYGGTLNGQAIVRAIGQPRQAFTADLTLNGLAYNKYVVGDLALKATNPSADRYLVDARLTGGPGNTDVRATGSYLASGALDMNVNLTRFNLNIIEPFSAGQLQQMSGYLSGQLAVTGTASAPQIRGQVTTNNAGFTLTQLGAPFTLPNETLALDNKGIAFQNFTLLDSLGNKGIINGYILTQNYADVGNYQFDLRAVTDNFIAVQSSARENPLYYGKLVVDSDTRITGNLNLPVVRTTASVVEPSALTVVVPNDEAGRVESTGIVEFIDLSAPLDTMLARQVNTRVAQTAEGYNVSATITVTDATPFTIIVDEVSGDNLRVQANGTLSTSIDQSGAITLSGRLEVNEGRYHLSLYDLTERDFDIAKGSSITWTGDPYNAQVDVSAIYNVRTAPAELLSSQGAVTDDPTVRNQLPFQVFLNVDGDLLKPVITFDIRLPEDARSNARNQIEARLAQLREPSQVDALNKQVFSLLVLNRFLAEDPFQSSSGNLVAEQLRGSASQVLTQQLNRLTGSYLSNLGVELGVNSQADFSSGSERTRTDLNVAVRRQLFNDRVSVRLGTDVPLAGGSSGNQSSSGQQGISSFAGDVSIEYDILANGRLRLRAYRNNTYSDIDGQYVRNGASLVFQRDYQNLADLFKGVDKDLKEERKEGREREKQEKKAVQDSVRNVVVPPRQDSVRRVGRVNTSGR